VYDVLFIFNFLEERIIKGKPYKHRDVLPELPEAQHHSGLPSPAVYDTTGENSEPSNDDDSPTDNKGQTSGSGSSEPQNVKSATTNSENENSLSNITNDILPGTPDFRNGKHAETLKGGKSKTQKPATMNTKDEKSATSNPKRGRPAMTNPKGGQFVTTNSKRGNPATTNSKGGTNPNVEKPVAKGRKAAISNSFGKMLSTDIKSINTASTIPKVDISPCEDKTCRSNEDEKSMCSMPVDEGIDPKLLNTCDTTSDGEDLLDGIDDDDSVVSDISYSSFSHGKL
jgi:hypothetical protein